MIRRFSSSPSSSIFIVSSTTTTKRTYITQQFRHREWSLIPEEDLELLGYRKQDNKPSKQELAIAFKRELSNIMSESAAMIRESQKFAETGDLASSKSLSGAAEVFKEGAWNQSVEDRTMATIADKQIVGDALNDEE